MSVGFLRRTKRLFYSWNTLVMYHLFLIIPVIAGEATLFVILSEAKNLAQILRSLCSLRMIDGPAHPPQDVLLLRGRQVGRPTARVGETPAREEPP